MSEDKEKKKKKNLRKRKMIYLFQIFPATKKLIRLLEKEERNKKS